jgi:small subunit ribosomal protein S24e
MIINIKNDKENKLLQRREIEFSVTYDSKTPQREELKVQLCKQLNLSPENTLIIKINQVYGIMKSDGVAHSYLNKESMKIEPSYLVNRSDKKNKKPKEEAKSTATA